MVLRICPAALEYSNKETVGAVARRGQEQIIVAAGRSAADRLVPGASDGHQRKIGRRGEKGFGLSLVLLAEQRTGGIHQPPTRTNQACRTPQDLLLALDQFGEVLGLRAPF